MGPLIYLYFISFLCLFMLKLCMFVYYVILIYFVHLVGYGLFAMDASLCCFGLRMISI